MKYNYSIIIPHYNIPHLLERLLNSIPQRDDLQVVIVDDCSPSSAQIELEKIKERFPYFEYYSTGINGGGGKARNIGLDYAKGKYVIFADADDYFTDKFNEVLNSSINCDILFCNAKGLYEHNLATSNRIDHVNRFINIYIINRTQGELYLKYLFGEPWCKIINRELIENNHIRFEETPIHNDTLFSYMIGWYAKEVDVVTDVVYIVTDRPSSVSKKVNWKNLEIRTNVFARKEKFLKDHHIPIFDELLLTPIFFYIKYFKPHGLINYFKIIRREKLPATLIVNEFYKKVIRRLKK